MWLSPEAEKARREGWSRQKMWWPSLSLLPSGKMIVQHAMNNRRGQRQALVRLMQDKLGWTWNGQKGWFQIDQNPENLKALLDEVWCCTYYRVRLSPGASEYIVQVKPEKPTTR